MLTLYIKELSREVPAKAMPAANSTKETREWLKTLKIERSDMQAAVQVLGQLRKVSNTPLDEGEIDLTATNLQGFHLSHLNFEKVIFKGACLLEVNFENTNLRYVGFEKEKLPLVNFTEADLTGNSLKRANLQKTKLFLANIKGAHPDFAKLQGTDLDYAYLNGADLDSVTINNKATFVNTSLHGAAIKNSDLTGSSIRQEQLETMFGDASVILPGGNGPEHKNWPKHWSKEELGWPEFGDQWRAFQVSIGQDPDNPE